MGDDRPSIFFIYSDTGGCGYLRCWLPAEELGRRGWEVSYPALTQYSDTLIAPYDLVVFQRQGAGQALENMRRYKAMGKAVVYEIDDYALMVPNRRTLEKEGYGLEHADRETVIGCLREADLVTVTTDALRQVYSRFNPRIVVLPNCTHPAVNARTRPPNQALTDRVTIGYAAALAHGPDSALLEKVLPAILEKYDFVDFVFFGDLPKGWGQDLPNAYHMDFVPIQQYYDVIQVFDIGVAPLVVNQYTLCKSALKGFDYLGAGVAPVLSDHPVYEVFTHKVNCLKARHRKDWVRWLSLLVDNPGLREELVERGQEMVREYYIQNHIHRWEEAYLAVWDWVQGGRKGRFELRWEER